jgi:hypothetical protein
VPVPALVALALLLPIGPAGLLLDRGDAAPPPPGNRLARVAERAGCRLTEFRDGMDTNPPVNGRVIERISTPDGSYARRRAPSLLATTHALYHGRILFQYRPRLPAAELQALDRYVRKDPADVLLFENQTGMHAPVAATAYLSVMTCPRVDRRTLHALAEFRARRHAFGQGF